MSRLLRFIRAAAPVAGTDRELLDRFARDRDEEAFAAIVRRYGGGVWAACRRLADRDAEDAFQAVFLTLARKAGSVRGSLPAWLHGVARRTAANLRRSARRRSAAEANAARVAQSGPDDVTFREGLAVLDEELARLPERYRVVLIVCCLEGRSRDEAAAQLGWSEGRVKGCLERARALLRLRLVRRGIELGGILLAATLPNPAAAAPAIPPAAVLLAGRSVSPAAISLSHGVLHAMLVQKIAIAATILVATAVAGAAAYRTAGAGTATGTPIRTTEATTGEEPPVKELNRWEKRLRDKNLTAKERAAYEQIAKLHAVNLPQWSDRGAFDLFPPLSTGKDSELPTAVLYRMGVDVLPVLAEALDDGTPTQTVSTDRRGGKRVWKVNELVAMLACRIAERDFVVGESGKEVGVRDVGQHPKAVPELRKAVVEWHKTFAAKTPTERKVADVNDPWFRNRFDAVIWLGEHKVKEGRRAIEARVDGYYDDPKRSLDSTSQAEMTYCALALGQIGDKASLRQVRRVCEDMSYTIYMCYRPKEQGRWGAGSSANENLFRAYRGLTLLGKKDEAVKELNRLLAEYGPEMEASTRKDFEQRLAEAKGF